MPWDNEEELKTGLKALAAQTDNAAAPEWMEGSLLAAFRQQAATPRVTAVRYWAFAAVAAAVVSAVLLAVWSTRATPAPPAPRAFVKSVPPPSAPAPAPAPVRRKAVRRPASREVVTDFIPVLYRDPSVMESGYIVRVQMPRSALASFGLPMNEERAAEKVRADLLVGQDGLTRAIRFVDFRR